jgi:spore coat protein CotF
VYIMNLNLTQKEKTLLEDQKNHEQICIEKYKSYANQAQDPHLSKLFQTYATQEQQHLNTINQMLAGNVPNMQQQSQQNQQAQQTQQYQNNPQRQYSPTSMQDMSLCADLLMSEKFVSSAYNTAIFEFTDTNARQALNHIQKEEQQHGEGLFNYMQSQGMYNPQ